MKIKLLIATHIIFLSSIYCQSWKPYNWESNDSIKNTIFFDAYDFFKQNYKENIFVGDLLEPYAKGNTNYFYHDYKSGNIFPKFHGYENYIKQILREIIKDKNEINKLNIYFYNSAEFNASMDVFGNLRIYVGLFNYIKTEAELAAILAHEYAHYKNKDALDKATEYHYVNKHLNKFKFRKNQEAAADFAGILMLQNSNYSISGFMKVFKTFKRMDIKSEFILGNKYSYSETHPDPGERMAQVQMMKNDSLISVKKSFLVDSIKFMELKEVASQNSFIDLIEYNNYHELIELTFANYLFNPNNHENLALLIEGIRRYLVLNPKEKNKQFIIAHYKSSLANNNEYHSYISSNQTSILNHLNKGLINVFTSDLKKIKTPELLDSINIKFKTYEEALSYFKKVALEVNCKPCLFTSIFNEKGKLSYNEDAQKNNLIFNCNSFINNLKTNKNLTESVIILKIPEWEDDYEYDVKSNTIHNNKLKKCLEDFKANSGYTNVKLMTDFSFKEQHLINSIDILPNLIFSDEIAKNSIYKFTLFKTLDWSNFSPEIFEFYSKYNLKNVFIVDIHTYTYIETMKGALNYGKEITFRCVDYKKIGIYNALNNIRIEATTGIGGKNELNDENLINCAKDFKWFMMYNK